MIQAVLEFSKPCVVPDEETQCGILLRHMQNVGPITTGEAFELYRITCAGQRMTDLRNRFGWPVKSDPYKTPGGAIVAKYYLARRA